MSKCAAITAPCVPLPAPGGATIRTRIDQPFPEIPATATRLTSGAPEVHHRHPARSAPAGRDLQPGARVVDGRDDQRDLLGRSIPSGGTTASRTGATVRARKLSDRLAPTRVLAASPLVVVAGATVQSFTPGL